MVERRRHPRADATAINSPAQVYGIASQSPLPRRTRRTRNAAKHSPMTLSLWSSRILLMGVAAIYSTNFASVKYLETVCLNPPCDHDPSEATFCRFLISACVCLPILYANRQYVKVIKAGLECGFWFTLNYICQAEALEYIPAGKCAFIAALSVVTVPLFAGIFLGKPIRAMSLVSAMIALVGVAILENLIPIGAGAATEAAVKASGSTIMGLGKGDMLALGQPVGFGFAVMRIDYYLEKYSHVPNRVLTMTAAQCVTVCVLASFWVVCDSGGRLPDLSYMLETHRLITLAWTGIFSTVVAVVLQGIALEKASATDASLIFSTEPVWGSLFAGWLLNEKLTTTTYIGGAFILAACLLGGLTDSSDESSSKKGCPQLKSKSSSVQDSLLPTLVDPDIMQGELKTEFSIQSLTDVQHFPTITKDSSARVPAMIDDHSTGKMHAFI